jgi:hypothetical protein
LILLHAASSTQNDSNARERKDMGEAPEPRGGDVAAPALVRKCWRDAESLEEKRVGLVPWLQYEHL